MISDEETPEAIHTRVPTDPNDTNPTGFRIGLAHTHPRRSSLVFASPGPSGTDKTTAKGGLTGRQQFLVDQDGVWLYFKDAPPQFLGDLKSVLPAGVKCVEFDLTEPHKP